MNDSETLHLLPRDWREELAVLVRSATSDLLIVSPYFTSFGTQHITKNLSSGFARHGTIRFLTDLSPLNICSGATQPTALVPLQAQIHRLQITHLPKLHAKTYVADNNRAIITSGNLTAGGLVHNHEYGLLLLSEHIVTKIRRDIDEFTALGAEVSGENLQTYAQLADDLLKKYERRLKSAQRELTREFEQTFRQAEDELLALRIASGAITTIFEKTVIYLLRKYGTLSTQQIHPMIKAIHPDLCDDSIDRVINGQHFGKKWKHAVRRAQSHLKDRGEIIRTNGLWHMELGQT